MGQAIPKGTYGALDLGGASTQITFIPEDYVSLLRHILLHVFAFYDNTCSNFFFNHGTTKFYCSSEL